MKLAPNPPQGNLRFVTPATAAELSRRAKAGRAVRLAPGIYVEDATLDREHAARHHLYNIVAHVWPGAVIWGRSALTGGQPEDGRLYVCLPELGRTSDLRLPGVTVKPSVGPPALPGDMDFVSGLHVSGVARTLIENTDVRGRRHGGRAGTPTVETRIDELARSGGAGRVQNTLAQLDVIAGHFAASAVEATRVRLAAVLGTNDAVQVQSPCLRARLAGLPYDEQRLVMLRDLVDVLEQRAPRPVPISGAAERWNWLAFFEAYFSNFIEGTEFGVDEARAIAIDGVVPAARPADAHDVAATYRLAADPGERARVPRSADGLVALLQERHEKLMAARPDKHPGEFKEVANFAGGYRFVDPTLVEGTLRHGFAIVDGLTDPFGRAVAMMLLITEVHPFDDGNGRLARLMANSELSVAGQVRLVIPSVYRTNYLVVLTAISNRADPGRSLIAVLEYAQRWAAAVDWTEYQQTNDQLVSLHAYLDPGIADATGQHLLMPA